MDRLNENTSSAEAAISYYLHGKAGGMKLPLNGTFELTSRCNFDCKMCYIHTADCNAKRQELSAEWWIETGKKAVEHGMLFLLITGGEPLIREDFPLIYTELKKLGLFITINTNGYLLKGKIAKLFKENPPFRINVSLYGSSDDVYEKLTGRRAFSTVIQNVEEMRSYGIDVKFNSCITKENAFDSENIYNLSKKMGMHIKTVAYAYPPLRANGTLGNNNSRLSPEAAAKCRVDLSLLKYGKDEFIKRGKGMQQGISMFLEECLDEHDADGVRCRAGRSSFWITKTGEMLPCGMIDCGFDVKELGFSEAWQRVLEFTGKITLPKKCANCEYRHFCNVCAAVCYTETGKFSSVPDYVCRFSAETAKQTKIQLERLEKEI